MAEPGRTAGQGDVEAVGDGRRAVPTRALAASQAGFEGRLHGVEPLAVGPLRPAGSSALSRSWAARSLPCFWPRNSIRAASTLGGRGGRPERGQAGRLQGVELGRSRRTSRRWCSWRGSSATVHGSVEEPGPGGPRPTRRGPGDASSVRRSTAGGDVGRIADASRRRSRRRSRGRGSPARRGSCGRGRSWPASGRGSAGCSGSPRISAAALRRVIQSRRNSRFLARRSRIGEHAGAEQGLLGRLRAAGGGRRRSP